MRYRMARLGVLAPETALERAERSERPDRPDRGVERSEPGEGGVDAATEVADSRLLGTKSLIAVECIESSCKSPVWFAPAEQDPCFGDERTWMWGSGPSRRAGP